MQSAFPPRLLPAALTALVVGFLLQLLMQSLIDQRGAPPQNDAEPVELEIVVPPPPDRPVTPTREPPPPIRHKPPNTDGLIQLDPVIDVTVAPGPTPTVTGPPSLIPHGPGEFLITPTLPDQLARARTPVQPRFPERARRAERRGEVLVSFTVRTDGRASDIEIESAQPRGFGFEQAVRRALLQARFAPARSQGQVVDSRLRQSFVFELETD